MGAQLEMHWLLLIGVNKEPYLGRYTRDWARDSREIRTCSGTWKQIGKDLGAALAVYDRRDTLGTLT